MSLLEKMRNRLSEAMARAYKEPGNWMSTATGGFWFFKDPDPLDVDIVDVAYGLARQTRYNGQYRTDVDFYSVSEHSRLMTDAMFDELDQELLLEDALSMLLHDMPEDVIGDMLSMLKQKFPGYREFEDAQFGARFASFVADKDGIAISKSQIKELDIRIRMNERDLLIVEPSKTVGKDQERLPWAEGLPKPLNVKIEGNAPSVEAKLFLHHFCNLLENIPARLPENAPENNTLLLRHYMSACDHLGRDPNHELARAAHNLLDETADMEP